MSKNGTVHRALVDKIYALAGQIVQAIQINRLGADDDLLSGGLHIDHRLKHNSGAVLNELAHGVKIGGEIYTCREQTLLVLSFTLAEELLPPLRYVVYCGLIVCKNLNALALAEQNITKCCVLQCVILLKIILQSTFSSACSTGHQLIDVRTADCDGQQTYCGKNRETSSHIIRNDKGLVAFLGSQILQASLCLVGRRINSLGSALFPVLLLQDLLEYAEGDCRLGSGTGLGDHIDGEISVAHYIHQVLQIGRADGITAEIDLGSLSLILGKAVVEAVAQKLDGSSGTKIRTSDTNHKQNLGIALNLLRCSLNSGKLFFVVIDGKIDPSQEIISRTALGYKYLLCIQSKLLHISDLFV